MQIQVPTPSRPTANGAVRAVRACRVYVWCRLQENGTRVYGRGFYSSLAFSYRARMLVQAYQILCIFLRPGENLANIFKTNKQTNHAWETHSTHDPSVCRLLLFKVWSKDQRHQHHLGACQKHRPTLKLHSGLAQSESMFLTRSRGICAHHI